MNPEVRSFLLELMGSLIGLVVGALSLHLYNKRQLKKWIKILTEGK